MKPQLVPLTVELLALHRKRLEIPEFAKWWARYVHITFEMKRAMPHLDLGYTDEDLMEAYERAFAALPPELL